MLDMYKKLVKDCFRLLSWDMWLRNG